MVLARDGDFALQLARGGLVGIGVRVHTASLHAGFDDVKRVHDQDL